MEGRPLLLGVAGSRAHGLERLDSDWDRRGIWAEPTERMLGLGRPPQSERGQHAALWEAKHAVLLALTSNPHVLELLWLPEYEVISESGLELTGMRDVLVSREAVRRSYLDNARMQYRMLMRRVALTRKMDWARTHDAEDDARFIRKRARHVTMSVIQGTRLWWAGEVPVRLTDPMKEYVLRMETHPELLEKELDGLERVLAGSSVLPETPDRGAAERWLLRVRERNWKRAE